MEYIQNSAEQELKQFLNKAKDLGVEPTILSSLLTAYNSLGDTARGMLYNRQAIDAKEQLAKEQTEPKDSSNKIVAFQAYDSFFCKFEGEATPHVFRERIQDIQEGDAFLVGEGLLYAESASHQNFDEQDEPWIVYDDSSNGWFEEDLGSFDDLCQLQNVVRADIHIDPAIFSNLLHSITCKIEEELRSTPNGQFIDVCAEAPFPQSFYPGHSLVVWGEENDADDKFYSVTIYKNNSGEYPDEPFTSTMSDNDNLADLKGVIADLLIRFDEKKRAEQEHTQSTCLDDQIKSAQQKVSSQPSNSNPAKEFGSIDH